MNKLIEILNDIKFGEDFTNIQDFIEEGIFDSFDIISLIDEIEDGFDIKIDSLDILPENFVSIDSIANLIKKNGGIL